MAGSWTLLPLGFKVVTKINQIIREEMNAIGGQEMLMPLMHPKELWNETGRWEKAREVMQFADTIAFMELGRIVWIGPRQEADAERLTAAYLGKTPD